MLPAVTDCICSASRSRSSDWSTVSESAAACDQLALLAEVEQHVVGEHLAQHAGDEDLLADDPVEVAARAGRAAGGRTSAPRAPLMVCTPAGKIAPE